MFAMTLGRRIKVFKAQGSTALRLAAEAARTGTVIAYYKVSSTDVARVKKAIRKCISNRRAA